MGVATMCTIVDMFFFFFNDTATTEIYTLSLHDALPISGQHSTAEISSFLLLPLLMALARESQSVVSLNNFFKPYDVKSLIGLSLPGVQRWLLALQ